MPNVFKGWVFAVLIVVAVPSTGPAQTTTDPAEVKLAYDDIRRFVAAYDMIVAGADTLETLEAEYLELASPGLRDYARRYDLTSESLVEAIRRRPDYYASLSDLADRLEGQERAVREALAGFKRIHPDIVYPPVYFLVGHMRAGGAMRMAGLLISAEMYAMTAETDLSEFPDGPSGSFHKVEHVKHLVVHELAHYQQLLAQGLGAYRSIYGESGNLLAVSIREGSADFLAYLASGDHINQHAHEYGLAHEAELWSLFREEMYGRETGDWMFVRPSRPEWSQDLGYFMGFKIVESYYENAAEKSQAILDILSVTDYEEFLGKSGYAERFDGN
jgi:hypothetical protein